MAGPWEKYQKQGGTSASSDGPWTKYQAQAASQSPEFQQDLSELSQLSNTAYDNSYSDAGRTFLNHSVGDLPIVGPALQKAGDYAGSNIWGAVTGEDPAAIRQKVEIDRKVRDNQYPMSATSGMLAANIAPMAAAGGVPAASELLGMTGSNAVKRIIASGASNAAISGADTLARGGSGADALKSEAISGGLGFGISGVGEAITHGIGAAYDRFAPTVRALIDPDNEASRRVGAAMLRDMRANPASVMDDIDTATAHEHGIPLVNADYGGETVRALARSVANQAPEARNLIDKLANERFASQSARASDFVKKLAGGNVDDIAYKAALRQQAQSANKSAYQAAYNDPNAASVFTDGIQELMQSPSFRKAMNDVPAKSADRGALTGQKALPMPFDQDEFGNYVIKRNPDGSVVTPSLEFWDHTKRNLDDMIDSAQRSGNNDDAGTLTGIKRKLTGELDGQVPSYKSARQGAAGFFSAEDALEAGKNFANAPRSIPEARQAFSQFSEDQKKAFRTGHASELIDRIKASSDRTNVINRVFKSEAARESMGLVYGPQKAKEIEAYVRVEDLADRLRGAMGNSTTAKQLVELGLGGAAGGWMGSDHGYGGTALGFAGGLAGAFAGRTLVSRANSNSMIQIANLLARNSPGALQAAVKIASQRPAYMDALEKLSTVVGTASRGATVAAPRLLGQEPRQPMELTVHPHQ